MARSLFLCTAALLVASGLSDPVHHASVNKKDDKTFLQHQIDLTDLFWHVHEPVVLDHHLQIVESWKIEKNVEHFANVTAVKLYLDLCDNGLLARGLPFTFLEQSHTFEAVTFFNVLYSAKDYETFYKTAVWARQHVNEYLFVHILTTVILHRPDTQGIIIPPIFEIFPSFFNNGEIMTTAQRLNSHGIKWIEHDPTVYEWENHAVIRANYTYWPYQQTQNVFVNYFTHDEGLNALYYNLYLTYPKWLGGDVVPLVKDNRGQWLWFIHKQLITRYYMERLSNGLSEIPELTWNSPIEEGVTSGLIYANGIPFPSRQSYLDIEMHPEYTSLLTEIQIYEQRIFDAIDSGFYITPHGEYINIRTPEAIDVIGRLMEANVDSPNTQYYGDFMSLWKMILGNSVRHHSSHHDVDVVVPGLLEQYQTAMRDPAFFMLWKRVLRIFDKFHRHLPHYKREELAMPSVEITSVDVTKLSTFFDKVMLNVTNHLYMDQHEIKNHNDEVQVLVEKWWLQHKPYTVKLNVKCTSATKPVLVQFFLAPKYDSKGQEIPLHDNYENFFMMDQFIYELKEGDNEIQRLNDANMWANGDFVRSSTVYKKAQMALHESGNFDLNSQQRFDGFPRRLILPKGRVNGMPFLFMVHITEYVKPKIPFGTGYEPAASLGLGSGSRYLSDVPLGFPMDRPLYEWQVKDLHNFHLKDVLIYHKPATGVYVSHLE